MFSRDKFEKKRNEVFLSAHTVCQAASEICDDS